jgi:hypothetical protein
VWGSSGSDVYAVGYDGSSYKGTILHYDGSAWSTMSSGTDNSLYAVWGSSGADPGPPDVYAVGRGWDDYRLEDYGTILHYSGPPDLDVRKEVTPPGPIPYQGTISYTVVLGNSGAANASGVSLTDTLPVEVDFGQWVERPSGAGVTDDEITWSGTVTAGEAITLAYMVDHVGLYDDVVTNRARYSHASGSGSDEATFAVEEGLPLYLPLITKPGTP